MHIRWSHNETDRVVNKAAGLRIAEPLLTHMDALYRAQGEVIEKPRIREKLGYDFEKALIEKIRQREQVLRTQIPPTPEPPPPPPPQKNPLELLIEMISDAVVQKLQPIIQNTHQPVPIRHVIMEQQHRLPGDAPLKKRVVVIAANNDQRRHLEKEFPDLDFEFCPNGAKGDKVAHLANGAHLVVGMVKFMRHHAEKVVKSMPHYVRVNGGASSVATIIRSRLNGNGAGAHH